MNKIKLPLTKNVEEKVIGSIIDEPLDENDFEYVLSDMGIERQ